MTPDVQADHFFPALLREVQSSFAHQVGEVGDLGKGMRAEESDKNSGRFYERTQRHAACSVPISSRRPSQSTTHHG